MVRQLYLARTRCRAAGAIQQGSMLALGHLHRFGVADQIVTHVRLGRGGVAPSRIALQVQRVGPVAMHRKVQQHRVHPRRNVFMHGWVGALVQYHVEGDFVAPCGSSTHDSTVCGDIDIQRYALLSPRQAHDEVFLFKHVVLQVVHFAHLLELVENHLVVIDPGRCAARPLVVVVPQRHAVSHRSIVQGRVVFYFIHWVLGFHFTDKFFFCFMVCARCMQHRRSF
mmetsp:Transcript_64062/g.113156  ORF Transcript_64062/g.113156 Transcript_64062/m.113156 type:complete len:225 (-) Transcript_64062:255-929(-)